MGIMDLFKKKTSGNVAKDRLKLVLVSDRANCSSEMMEMMKNSFPYFCLCVRRIFGFATACLLNNLPRTANNSMAETFMKKGERNI